jgi:murein L,D-transpeptidase YcbB/YkuD
VFSTCNQQDQKPELSATEPAINGMDLQSSAADRDYLQLKIVQKVSNKRINWTMINGPDSWMPQAASHCEAGRLFLTVHKTSVFCTGRGPSFSCK